MPCISGVPGAPVSVAVQFDLQWLRASPTGRGDGRGRRETRSASCHQ